MAQYCFGSMIKEYRHRLNISQEELSFGICDVSTMSKIENGKRLPHRTQAIALMNKLGIPVEYFNIPLSSNEYRKNQIEIEIINNLKKNTCDFYELIEEYKSIDDEMNLLEEQFYLFVTTFLEIKHYTPEEKINILTDAIKLTIPDFSVEYPIDCHLLTMLEIRIIMQLAVQYSKLKKKDITISLLKKLDRNFEKKYGKTSDFCEIHIKIISNLCMSLGLVNNIKESIDYAEKGIEISQSYENFVCLPSLLYAKGFSYILLYGQDNEIGINCLKRACILFEEFNRKKMFNSFKDKLIDTFGLNFWKKIEQNF